MNASAELPQFRIPVIGATVLLAAMQGSLAQDDQTAAQVTGVSHTRATWHVANNGVDSPDCGSRRSSCRTITQGIENAAAGDLVLVGPGLYGDVNGSCDFPQVPEEGEEFGFLACANVPNTSIAGARVCLNKEVTVASVAGAEATVIDSCGSLFGVVVLSGASNSTFGLPRRGFTVLGSNDLGGTTISVATPSNVTIGGNIARPDPQGVGFVVQFGENHRLLGNLARDGRQGFIAFAPGSQPTRGLRMIDNVAVSNEIGFDISGQDAVLLARNIATGNNVGVTLAGRGHILRGNSIVGNRQYGILRQVQSLNGREEGPIDIDRNNIFGNNNAPVDGKLNCGIVNDTNIEVNATNNFWGAPTGPGANPADEACDHGEGQIIHTPFAKKEFRLRHKSRRDFNKLEDIEEADVQAQ